MCPSATTSAGTSKTCSLHPGPFGAYHTHLKYFEEWQTAPVPR